MTSAVHVRVTRVRCDNCRTDHFPAVVAKTPRRPSESVWDTLLVEQLRQLGWRASPEPVAHHQRITRDICPRCVAGGK